MLKFILGMKELLPQEQETVLFLYGKAIKFLNPNLLKEYILEALTPGWMEYARKKNYLKVGYSDM